MLVIKKGKEFVEQDVVISKKHLCDKCGIKSQETPITMYLSANLHILLGRICPTVVVEELRCKKLSFVKNALLN